MEMLDLLPAGPFTDIIVHDLSKYGGGYEGQVIYHIKTACCTYAVDPQKNFVNLIAIHSADLATITIRDLANKQLEPFRHSQETFLIGGRNSDEIIRSMTSLNGKEISYLEKSLKPNQSSTNGFLGTNDGLIETLLNDNRNVAAMGLTHQQMALPLLVIVKAIDKADSFETVYRGVKLKVNIQGWMGKQYSPFGDHLSSSRDVTVTNVETGAHIEFSEMLGGLIYKYGFYEGRGTSYRLEPKQIADVFGLLQPAPKP
jgi:hypothetical protein